MLLPFATPAQTADSYNYEGFITINPERKLDFVLYFRVESDGKATGAYYYIDKGQSLKLVGQREGQNLTLNEYDENGNKTGVWKGRFDSRGFEGTWSTPNGSRSFPFTSAASLSLGYKLYRVTTEVKTERFGIHAVDMTENWRMEASDRTMSNSFNAWITRYYPDAQEIDLSDYENDAEELKEHELFTSLSMEAVFKTPTFVSFRITWVYGMNPYSPRLFNDALVFDLRKGEPAELADFFGTSKPMLDMIAGHMRQAMNDEWGEPESETEIDYDDISIKLDHMSWDASNWYLLPQGVIFRLTGPGTYEEALDVFVSYREFIPYMKPGTSFDAWFNGD